MKLNPSIQSLGLAISALLISERHTGTNTVTSGLSSQINGSVAENVLDLPKEAKILEDQHTTTMILEKGPSRSDKLISLKKESSGRKRFTLINQNTTLLKHYKNPQRFRRG
jgi:hypothetical protein